MCEFDVLNAVVVWSGAFMVANSYRKKYKAAVKLLVKQNDLSQKMVDQLNAYGVSESVSDSKKCEKLLKLRENATFSTMENSRSSTTLIRIIPN